jgi:hypothetical protein
MLPFVCVCLGGLFLSFGGFLFVWGDMGGWVPDSWMWLRSVLVGVFIVLFGVSWFAFSWCRKG